MSHSRRLETVAWPSPQLSSAGEERKYLLDEWRGGRNWDRILIFICKVERTHIHTCVIGNHMLKRLQHLCSLLAVTAINRILDDIGFWIQSTFKRRIKINFSLLSWDSLKQGAGHGFFWRPDTCLLQVHVVCVSMEGNLLVAATCYVVEAAKNIFGLNMINDWAEQEEMEVSEASKPWLCRWTNVLYRTVRQGLRSMFQT